MTLVMVLVIVVHLRIRVVIIDKGEKTEERERESWNLVNICSMVRTLNGLLTLIVKTLTFCG